MTSPSVREAPLVRRSTRPAALPGVTIELADDHSADEGTPVEFPALLSSALRGVVPRRLILLWGEAGAGKSTLAAELAHAIARAQRGLIWWADADQDDTRLVVECFERLAIPRVSYAPRLRVIRPSPGAGWRPLLRAVPVSAPVLVLDSVQALTDLDDYREQRELLRAARRYGPIVIAISEATKALDAAGRASNKNAGDAAVNVLADRLVVTKCRWVRRRCPYEVPRPPYPSSAAGDLAPELE